MIWENWLFKKGKLHAIDSQKREGSRSTLYILPWGRNYLNPCPSYKTAYSALYYKFISDSLLDLRPDIEYLLSGREIHQTLVVVLIAPS